MRGWSNKNGGLESLGEQKMICRSEECVVEMSDQSSGYSVSGAKKQNTWDTNATTKKIDAHSDVNSRPRVQTKSKELANIIVWCFTLWVSFVHRL